MGRRSLRLIQKKIAQEAQADLIMVNSSSEGASQRRKKKRKRKSTSVKTKRFRDKSTQTLNSVELDEIASGPVVQINQPNHLQVDPLQEPENKRKSGSQPMHGKTTSSITIVPINEVDNNHIYPEEIDDSSHIIQVNPDNELAQSLIEPLQPPSITNRIFRSKIPINKNLQRMTIPQSELTVDPVEHSFDNNNVNIRKLKPGAKKSNDVTERKSRSGGSTVSNVSINEYDHLINSKNVTIRRGNFRR